MTIPPDLSNWKTQMASSTESSQVLQNLLDEPCLDAAVEAEFFSRISAAPSSADAYQAWELAMSAVWSRPPLNFNRSAVTSGRFDNLVRFTLPTKVPALIPSMDVAALGLSIGDLDRASIAELTSVMDEASLAPGVNLHNVVWVAEVTPEIDATLASPGELMDRLGLPGHLVHLASGGCCVELRYRRADLPTGNDLHVPSALDDIDNSAFRPETDCKAPCGMTQPLTAGASAGVPEAIHRGCIVTPFEIKLLLP
jgi:hypothetical protein